MKFQLIVDYIKQHFYKYSSQYIFVIVLFVMGVVFGAILVNSLSLNQKDDLYDYLAQFFYFVNTEELISFKELFSQNILHHLKHLAFFFLLGISIIGLPIVLILLFLKGIVVGFTVGFLVNQLSFQGFLIAFLSIFPQNIIIVPVFLIATVLTINFSIKLIQKLFTNNPNMVIWPFMFNYLKGFLILIFCILTAASIEALVSINFLKLVLNSI